MTGGNALRKGRIVTKCTEPETNTIMTAEAANEGDAIARVIARDCRKKQELFVNDQGVGPGANPNAGDEAKSKEGGSVGRLRRK